jgi:hypothetical protein
VCGASRDLSFEGRAMVSKGRASRAIAWPRSSSLSRRRELPLEHEQVRRRELPDGTRRVAVAVTERLMTGPLQKRAVVVLALAALLVGACKVASPAASTGSTEPGPSLPGTLGHFDNGGFSFDYPATWRTLSGLYDEGFANEVDAVLGTGDWRTGCIQTTYPDGHGGGSCTGDTFVVSAGRIVVKVWRRVGGPADMCRADVGVNATLGPNAVLRTGSDSAPVWEIREPGGQFGWSYNVFIEAHTDGASGVAAAEAVIASFRWAAGRTNGGCYQMDTPSPS